MLTHPSLINRAAKLSDSRGRDIGTINVESAADDLLTGTFEPGSDYPAVRKVFLEFEEAANDQAMTHVDRCANEIEALGLQIEPQGAAPVRVFDVQIWSDGGVSCRLRPFQPRPLADQSVNGAPASAGADHPSKAG